MLSVITAACGRNDSSPTATFKAFFEAAKNNDIESMKKRVSEDYKRSFATADREMKQPEDEMFRITARSYAGLGAMPEVRNEKIEGDKASLEFKVEMTGEWKTLKFVSESGKWKVD
jgi:hypothetical protein